MSSSSSRAFYTDVPPSTFQQVRSTQKQLAQYLDSFDSKLNYAKWKQQLVLMYNYEPLSSIVKKTEDVKNQYLKKIYDENDSNKRMYNTAQIAEEVGSFREFSAKLERRLAELKGSIDQWQMKKEVLVAELEDRRATLKGILDGNFKMQSEILRNRGIKTTTHIAEAMQTMREKAQSMKFIPKTSRSIAAVLPTRKPSQTTHLTHTPTPIPSALTARKPTPLGLNRLLFQQCLDLLIKSIKSMNSSQDIQQGIFLDLVSKHKPKPINAPQLKRSGPGSSMIYDILLKSYNERRKKEFDFDFVIEWETFRRFNWRQMLGVLLMRKGCYEGFRAVARKWD